MFHYCRSKLTFPSAMFITEDLHCRSTPPKCSYGDLQHTMTSISAMSHHSKSTVYRHPHLQYFLTADLQRTSIATSVGFYYCRS